VATDVSALRLGDLASATDFRTTCQNDGRRHLAAAQNGTSGALAMCKQTHLEPTWVTPGTGPTIPNGSGLNGATGGLRRLSS
jgi:hypothetical protein